MYMYSLLKRFRLSENYNLDVWTHSNSPNFPVKYNSTCISCMAELLFHYVVSKEAIGKTIQETVTRI